MTSPTTQKNKGWLGLLLNRYKAVAGKEIAVGFPQGKCQAYPDGESVAQVAYDNVNGVGVPVRDFMSYADPRIKKKTAPLLKAIAKAANEGKDRAVAALQEAAGMEGAQAVKDAILEGVYEPNAEYTIEKKGSSKPLIDTSHMLQSATYVVRSKRK